MTPSRLLTSIALATGTTFSAFAAEGAGADYRAEALLGYQTTTTDDVDDDLEDATIYVNGAYFFDGVEVGDNPYEEADFLGHESYIAGYSRTPWQTSRGVLVGMRTVEQGDGLDADGFSYGLSGQWGGTEDLALTLGAGFLASTVEDDDIDAEIETVEWTINVGWFVLPNALVGLRYTTDTTEFSDVETDGSLIDLFGKIVHRFGGDQAINGELSIGSHTTDPEAGDETDSIVVDAAIDWYPVQQYGIGVLLGNVSGDEEEGEGFSYGLRGSAWFTDYFGVRAGFEQFAADLEEVGDETTWWLELVGRF